jgi:hypothetical protein
MMPPGPTAPLGQGEEYELKDPGAHRYYDPEADAAIIDWRTLSFMELGFNAVQSSVLAMRRDVDREYVERLVGAGCTHGTAMRILASDLT